MVPNKQQLAAHFVVHATYFWPVMSYYDKIDYIGCMQEFWTRFGPRLLCEHRHRMWTPMTELYDKDSYQ